MLNLFAKVVFYFQMTIYTGVFMKKNKLKIIVW